MITPDGLKHLAIIMDGNGRWATDRNLPRSAGHLAGYRTFRVMLEYLVTLNIPEVTFFTLSSENLKRPKPEVAYLMKLFLDAVANDLDDLKRNKIEVKVIGDFDNLPSEVVESIEVLHVETASLASKMRMNICFAFGGKWHIEQAFLKCQQCSGDIKDFISFLEDPFLSPIDLVIRTGGVYRISNFALWQIAYAELIFLHQYWPDMTSEHLNDCLAVFAKRERRFGQLQ